MAYTFNKVFDSMQNDSSNIFGQSGQGEDPNDKNRSMQAGQGAEAIGQGQTTSDQGKSAPRVTSTGSADSGASKMIMQNTPQKTPGFLGKIGQDISASTKKAQEEANAFVANQKYDSGVDEGKVVQATKTGDFSGINEYLQPKEAKGGDLKYSSDDNFVDTAKSLGTTSGIQNKLLEGVGGMYSGKRARFDANSLLGSEGYTQAQKDLERQASEAVKQRTDLERASEEKTKEMEAQALAAKQAAFKNAIAKQKNQLQKDLQSKYVANEENRKNLQENMLGGDYTKAEAEKALAELKGNKDLVKYLDMAAKGGNMNYMGQNQQIKTVDPKQFFKSGKDQFTWRDMADAEQASRFNNIETLLGISGAGGQLGGTVGANYNPLSGASFDKAAYQEKMMNIANQLKAAEQFKADMAGPGLGSIGISQQVQPTGFTPDQIFKLLAQNKKPLVTGPAQKQQTYLPGQVAITGI
jgi:hypothetical protein